MHDRLQLWTIDWFVVSAANCCQMECAQAKPVFEDNLCLQSFFLITHIQMMNKSNLTVEICFDESRSQSEPTSIACVKDISTCCIWWFQRFFFDAIAMKNVSLVCARSLARAYNINNDQVTVKIKFQWWAYVFKLHVISINLVA